MQKKPVIIISVLCVISLGLGYWVGLPKEGSGNSGDKKEPEFLKQGLVAYYPFNGNAKDESGNGNDGEVSGATLTKDRHGNTDKAYGFDGTNDSITLPSDIFIGIEGFTLAVWVRLNSSSPQHFLISGATKGDDNKLLIGIWNKHFCIRSKNEHHEIMPEAELMGSWKHIAVTKPSDKTTFALFIDGMLRKSVSFTTHHADRFVFAPGGLMIGPDQDSVGGGFQSGQLLKGTVDDYRIYNRALSETEVKALYEFESVKP